MHKLFYISVILKGLNGLLEIAIGIAAFFVSQTLLVSWVNFLTRRELLQDSQDLFANYLVSVAQNYSTDVQLFVALYLLIHGMVKLFLVIGLLQKKLWVYPTAMVVFALFVVYQVTEYVITPHPSLVVLTILDLVIITLTWQEYKKIKRS